MKILKTLLSLVLLLFISASINTVYSQDTFLDATFGNNGKVVFDKVDATEQATCLSKQSNGKTIAAGTFITRYNLDGSVDTTFGTNGFVKLLPITYVNSDYQTVTNDLPFKVTAIAVNLNNEIIVAIKPSSFLNNDNFYMYKLSANGQVDATFNFADTNYTYMNKSINVIKCLPNGKILCGGGSYHQMGSYSTYFKQVNANGSVDTSFNTDIYFRDGMVSDIQIQNDGKYVIIGNNPLGEYFQGQSSYCGRINQDGSTDVYFGNLGFISINHYLHNIAYNCKIDPNGKILILQRNYTEIYDPSYYTNISYLSRYSSNGNIDTSFGDNGISIKFQSIDGYSNRKVFLDNSQNIFTSFTHSNKIQIDKYDTNGRLLNSLEKGASAVSNNFADVLQTTTGELYFLATSYSFSDYSLLKTNSSLVNDAIFGNNGYVSTGFETTIENNYNNNTHNVFDSKLQADGKIIVSGVLGNNLIKRFNVNGLEDLSFNFNSKYNAEIITNQFNNSSLALTSDNKIVVGYVGTDTIDKIYIYKLNSDGTKDITFLNNNVLEIDNPSIYTSYNGFNILASTNYFYVVYNGQDQAQNDYQYPLKMFIRKYFLDGTLDTSFGTNGKVEYINFKLGNAILLENEIYIGGTLNNDFNLIKLLSNGSIDTTFGVNGLVTTDFSIRNDKITKLLASSDYKIIALGSSNSLTAAAKYNLNGSFDTSFGISGRLLITQNALKDAVLQTNNEVVFITNNNDDFLLTKLTNTGQIDIAFGSNGIITTNFGHTPENAKNLLIQPNGQLIAIGNREATLMARYGNYVLSNKNFEEAFSNIKTYPNPFIDKLYIDFDTSVAQISTFKLYDITGNEIQIDKIETQPNKVALQMPQHLKSGLYFLQIMVNNKTKTVKIVK